MSGTSNAFFEGLTRPRPKRNGHLSPAGVGLRSSAFQWVAEHGFPTTKDEAWKYTRVAPILQIPFEPAVSRRLSAGAIEQLTDDFGGAQIVVVNGYFAKELSSPTKLRELNKRAKVMSLAVALAEDEELLAPFLARPFQEQPHAFTALSAALAEDGVLADTKLIAEPWDIGQGGYNVGGFPPLWTEWNGKYRDTVRDFWRGEDRTLAEFASRLTGSADLYEQDGRRPFASINFVTAHDGFTMHDLVSYNHKHNDANGEGGNDGESHNSSWNCGVEGETDDLDIVVLREQQKRNMLTTLFLSQGVPMLLHGDELGRTQLGNNNVYAQDSELSWIDWERAKDFEVLTDFTARLSQLRRDHPVFRRRRHFRGRVVKGSTIEDIGWFTPAGEWMSEDDWESGFARSVAVFLNGDAIREPDARGEPVVDDSFFLLFNGHYENIDFTLPDLGAGEAWDVVIDTAAPLLDDAEPRTVKTGAAIEVDARSVLVLKKAF